MIIPILNNMNAKKEESIAIIIAIKTKHSNHLVSSPKYVPIRTPTITTIWLNIYTVLYILRHSVLTSLLWNVQMEFGVCPLYSVIVPISSRQLDIINQGY